MSDNIEVNMQHAKEAVTNAAKAGAQIICLPELYRSLYFCQRLDPNQFETAEALEGPSTQMFATLAKTYKVVIVIPIFEKRADGLYYNSCTVVNADGSYLGAYRKMHIPHDPGFEEKYYFAPGDLGFKVFNTAYGKVGTLICWDQWYPEAARITAMKGADFIFYPTAIGWADNEPDAQLRKAQLEAWETAQRAHSIANGVFVCSVNRTGKEEGIQFWGNSFVYSPFGELLGKTGHFEEETLVIECDLARIEETRRWWPFFRDRRIDAYKEIEKRYLS